MKAPKLKTSEVLERAKPFLRFNDAQYGKFHYYICNAVTELAHQKYVPYEQATEITDEIEHRIFPMTTLIDFMIAKFGKAHFGPTGIEIIKSEKYLALRGEWLDALIKEFQEKND